MYFRDSVFLVLEFSENPAINHDRGIFGVELSENPATFEDGAVCEMSMLSAVKIVKNQMVQMCHIRRSILFTMSLYVNFIVSYDTYWVRSHSYIVSCNYGIAFVYRV
jgi:hypothetical protein